MNALFDKLKKKKRLCPILVGVLSIAIHVVGNGIKF